MFYRKLFTLCRLLSIVALLSCSAGLGDQETVFLDQWWEIYDLSDEPSGVREMRDGTCLILTSDGDTFLHVLGDDTIQGPLQWTGGNGKYVIHGDYDVKFTVKSLTVDPPIWDFTLRYLTFSVTSKAKTCDRMLADDTGNDTSELDTN